MSDKAEYTQQEGTARRSKRRSCANHCKRFWWLHLIIFICIVVLVVCLVIFVGIPNIAQQKLDDATLEVDGINISQTRENTYTMAINSTIRSGGGVHATIRGFSGAMYLEDLEPHTPFVFLDFPETSSATLQTVKVSQHIDIPDLAAFTTFNTWLLSNETLRVTIKGDTHVRVSGVARDFPVTFKKTVEMKGLNHFKGLEVTENTISLTADDRGDNFHGFVTIPNASVLTIEIGNTTYATFLDGQSVGTSFIDNLILRPGDNNVTMRANIQQAPVLGAMSQRPACETGIIPFELAGQDVENQGERLAYFADALGASNLTVNINIGETLERDLDLTFECK